MEIKFLEKNGAVNNIQYPVVRVPNGGFDGPASDTTVTMK